MKTKSRLFLQACDAYEQKQRQQRIEEKLQHKIFVEHAKEKIAQLIELIGQDAYQFLIAKQKIRLSLGEKDEKEKFDVINGTFLKIFLEYGASLSLEHRLNKVVRVKIVVFLSKVSNHLHYSINSVFPSAEFVIVAHNRKEFEESIGEMISKCPKAFKQLFFVD